MGQCLARFHKGKGKEQENAKDPFPDHYSESVRGAYVLDWASGWKRVGGLSASRPTAWHIVSMQLVPFCSKYATISSTGCQIDCWVMASTCFEADQVQLWWGGRTR